MLRQIVMNNTIIEKYRNIESPDTPDEMYMHVGNNVSITSVTFDYSIPGRCLCYSKTSSPVECLTIYYNPTSKNKMNACTLAVKVSIFKIRMIKQV